jgi:uncharacterized membrane protein
VAAYTVDFALRHGRLTHAGGTPIGLIVLSAAALAALAVSGWLGGRLSYRYGVRVADEASQADGYQ